MTQKTIHLSLISPAAPADSLAGRTHPLLRELGGPLSPAQYVSIVSAIAHFAADRGILLTTETLPLPEDGAFALALIFRDLSYLIFEPNGDVYSGLAETVEATFVAEEGHA